MSKLSIHIVAWNSMSGLPDLFESLFRQTFNDFSVRVVDNGSNDGVEKWLREKYPTVMLIRNTRNLGLVAAYNQMFKFTLSKLPVDELINHYCLLISPDIILRPNCLEELVKAAEADLTIGSFTPKILKSFQDNQVDEVLTEQVCSDVIESTGLRSNRFRNFFERGAKELDQGQYDLAREIFGASGIFAMYRASALDSVRLKNGEYFDEAFFSGYHEVDLAWRLQGRGLEARFVPAAVAHCARGAYGQKKFGLFQNFRHHRQEAKAGNFFVVRNRGWVLVKNLSFLDMFLAAPWLVPSESLRLIYAGLFSPSMFWSFFQFLGGLPKILKKRKEILSRRTVPRSSISRWFV
jgi:GT2 family glycosyltransferase